MKKSIMLILGLFLIALPFLAFAQEAVLPPEMTNEEFLQLLLASLGGVKGMSALAIAGMATQLVAKFLNTNLMSKVWVQIPGIWKIVTIVTLTAVGGVLGMVSQGVSWGAALIHSSVLSAVMVLANQIYQHVTEPKAPVVK
jgi:hypothetical protein